MTGAVGTRVLFFAEAVTLAHVARPLVLARALGRARYEVHLASAPRYAGCFDGVGLTCWPLESISPERFMRALAAGAPIYDRGTLEAYVAEDLALIDRLRPDLVVGDFRLSLAVSAPLRGVPYANLTNAHWSPYALRQRFPVPELPLTRVLGERLPSAAFGLLQPLVFRLHARALNALRRRHGLAALGDLRAAYTWGDYTLYADVPELVPTRGLPTSHRYLGPVLWSPPVTLPAWWDALPQDRPAIYVTLGSSGPARLLPGIVEALAALPVAVLVATAGRSVLGALPGNVHAAEFLPGDLAARRSRLVVCNGGSATVYQALAEGTPVLGIASNMDQHLTMGEVDRVGAGRLLRSERLRGAQVRETAERMLADEDLLARARCVAGWFGAARAESRFLAVVKEVLGSAEPQNPG